MPRRQIIGSHGSSTLNFSRSFLVIVYAGVTKLQSQGAILKPKCNTASETMRCSWKCCPNFGSDYHHNVMASCSLPLFLVPSVPIQISQRQGWAKAVFHICITVNLLLPTAVFIKGQLLCPRSSAGCFHFNDICLFNLSS